jgi:hypothetical protein
MIAGTRNFIRCKLYGWDLLRQGENPSRAELQSPAFPTKDSDVRLEKMPPSGISPSSILKERFNIVRSVRFSRNMGIVPERLLEDRSNDVKLVSFPSVLGIDPSNELCDRIR